MQVESTLKRVSMRLYARVLIKGDPNKEVDGITPSSYNYTYNHLKNSPHGKEISLIDKTSEDKTVSNLEKYMRPHKDKLRLRAILLQSPFLQLQHFEKHQSTTPSDK